MSLDVQASQPDLEPTMLDTEPGPAEATPRNRTVFMTPSSTR